MARFCIAKDHGKWRVYDELLKSFCEPPEMGSSKPLARIRAAVLNNSARVVKFRVYYINFDYYSQEEFDTPIAAINYAKGKCFEFAVDRYEAENGKVTTKRICSWSPLSGLRMMSGLPLDIKQEFNVAEDKRIETLLKPKK
jgi:hypothetical protein